MSDLKVRGAKRADPLRVAKGLTGIHYRQVLAIREWLDRNEIKNNQGNEIFGLKSSFPTVVSTKPNVFKPLRADRMATALAWCDQNDKDHFDYKYILTGIRRDEKAPGEFADFKLFLKQHPTYSKFESPMMVEFEGWKSKK